MTENLTIDPAVTTALITSLDWRSRVVETVTVSSTLAARSRRSLQVAPLKPFLAQFLQDQSTENARVILPIATLPKRPLLSFHVEADAGGAYLLKRRETAERQLAYIEFRANQVGVQLNYPQRELFRAICEYSPGFWLRVRRQAHWWDSRQDVVESYIEQYLAPSINSPDLRYLIERAELLGARLRAHLGEPLDVDSSSDNLFLALPLLHQRLAIPTITELRLAVNSLDDFVNDCESIGQTLPLLTLAEYGRRYEAMVELALNIDRPSVIHIEQDLPLQLRTNGRVSIDLLFADGLTNHASFRVDDPDVQLSPPRRNWGGGLLRRVTPTTIHGAELPDATFTNLRYTREQISFYGAEEERESIVSFKFKLVAPRLARLVAYSLALITASGAFLSLWLPEITSQELAIFVVPTTLASGFLLVQTRTTLAARLQRFQRSTVLVTTMALWGIVLYLYLSGRVHIDLGSGE